MQRQYQAMFQEYSYLFKIVVIGDSGVGKTNLVSQFVDQTFLLDEKPTIGVEFSSKMVKINGIDIRSQIWDTAGQQRFRAVTKAYYNGALGALVVFDLTTSQSFQNVGNWISQIQQNTKKETIILLVGNKMDLAQRAVGQSRIDRFLDEAKLKIIYMQTSALTGHNVREAFQKLIQSIYQQKKNDIEVLKNKREQLKKVQIENFNSAQSPRKQVITLKSQQFVNTKQLSKSKRKNCC